MKLQQYLTEKQIIVGKGQKYGQIVFLAGGAASGKGFASTNFMETDKFKIRDVDEMKKAMIKLQKVKGDNPEIANADMGKPEDVRMVHEFCKKHKIKDKTLDLVLNGAIKGTLPNILFDVTLKDIGDINEVVPKLFEAGYKPIDIHLVWILTDYTIAIKQNTERERVVPPDIMLATHTGAALTVTDILRHKTGSIGTTIDGSINIILNNKENTVYLTANDTKETMTGKNKLIQQPGKPLQSVSKYGGNKSLIIKSFKYINVKEEGKPMKRSVDFEKELNSWDDLRKWVKSNIPKTKKTENIRRRKRI